MNYSNLTDEELVTQADHEVTKHAGLVPAELVTELLLRVARNCHHPLAFTHRTTHVRGHGIPRVVASHPVEAVRTNRLPKDW